MLVVCPECDKNLKVPETAAGKKIRCPGCKAAVPVPARMEVKAAPSQQLARKEAQPRRAKPEKRPLREEEEGEEGEERSSKMQCPECRSTSLEKLPPNAYSRHPGYVCSECGLRLRPPGSTGGYVLAILLGGFILVLTVGMTAVAFEADGGSKRMVGGALSLGLLGVGVAGWAITQLRLPMPLNAPARASRLWLWILVPVLVLLLLGGGFFCLMYYIHEMM